LSPIEVRQSFQDHGQLRVFGPLVLELAEGRKVNLFGLDFVSSPPSFPSLGHELADRNCLFLPEAQRTSQEK